MQNLKFKAGLVKLKIHEIFGFTNPETGEIEIQGLVRESLPSETTKVLLKRLGKKLQEELKTIDESVKELYTELGNKGFNEKNEEVISIPKENIEAFQAKMNEILNTDIEVSCDDFKFSDFDFKSKTPEYTYTLIDDFFPESN